MAPEEAKRRRNRQPKPDVPPSFTQLIRDLRRKSTLSQKEYAQQLGVEERTVSRWENGQAEPPALTFVYMLALAGLDITTILDGSLEIPGALVDAPPPPAYSLDRLLARTRELLAGQEKISQQLAAVADLLRQHDASMGERFSEARLPDLLEVLRALDAASGSAGASGARGRRAG